MAGELTRIFDKLEDVNRTVTETKTTVEGMKKDVERLESTCVPKELCAERLNGITLLLKKRNGNGHISTRTLWAIIGVFSGLVLTILGLSCWRG